MATNNVTNNYSPLTTKGDLFTFSTLNARLPVGGDAKTIFADSTQTLGLNYDYLDIQKPYTYLAAHDFSNGSPGGTETTCTGSQTGTGASGGTEFSTSFTGGNNIGVIGLETGTTTTGRGSVRLLASSNIYPGNGQLIFQTYIYLSALSNGTDTYSVNLGFFNLSATTAISSVLQDLSVCFNYTDGTNSGKWQGFCKNGSSSTVDLGITVAATTWYDLKIVINSNYSLITFYINGTSAGTLSTNLPTSSTIHAPGNIILKSAGTTNIIMYQDFIKIRKDFITPR